VWLLFDDSEDLLRIEASLILDDVILPVFVEAS